VTADAFIGIEHLTEEEVKQPKATEE